MLDPLALKLFSWGEGGQLRDHYDLTSDKPKQSNLAF